MRSGENIKFRASEILRQRIAAAYNMRRSNNAVAVSKKTENGGKDGSALPRASSI